MRNPEPYDFAEAKDALSRASRDQTHAAKMRADSAEKLAAAERAYRVALAQKIVELHSEGVAWSSTADLARGDKKVADLRYARDVAAGVADAAEQEAWRCSANRRSLDLMVGWSQRVAPDGQQQEPVGEPRAIGARRAA